MFKKHWKRAKVLLTIMHNTSSIEALKYKGQPPALRVHKLDGNRKKALAIDIDKRSGWRITFRFIDSEFQDVEIENYHKNIR